jgi:hypothetical protein
MLQKRFARLLLVVLALALWAGTANAQLTVHPSSSVTFNYTKGQLVSVPTTAALTITDAADNTAYTETWPPTYASGANWLTSSTYTGTAGTLGGSGADNFTVNLTTATAATMAAGTYTATIDLAETVTSTNTATISVTLIITAPITATAVSSATLFSEYGYVGAQPSSIATVTINNSDAASDTYTFALKAASTCPAWITATPTSTGVTTAAGAAGTGHATAAVPDTITFKVDYTLLTGGATTAAPIATCACTIKYLGTALAANANVSFTSIAIVSAPLVAVASATPLIYNRGTSTATAGTVTINVKPAAGVASAVVLCSTWTGPQCRHGPPSPRSRLAAPSPRSQARVLPSPIR